MSSRRRDALKTFFDANPMAGKAEDADGRDPAEASDAGAARVRPTSGAVKAIGLSLAGLAGELDDARALRRELDRSGRLVSLDPALIDAAFVTDRLSRDEEGDGAFAALVDSMRENGQQVPVLVRPHPDTPGRYQTAYGHRRIRAAARLGVPVRAILRELTDAELVLAQGKENTERRDLSFIERALFAKALTDRGFERMIVQDALSLHKSEIARLLQVAEAVPRHVAAAIGPAPKAGRPRWMALAEMLKSDAGRYGAQDEICSTRFREADSDRRFKLLFDRLSKRAVAAKALEVKDGSGQPIARMPRSGARPRIDFVGSAALEFADFVAGELPGLIERFEVARRKQPGGR